MLMITTIPAIGNKRLSKIAPVSFGNIDKMMLTILSPRGRTKIAIRINSIITIFNNNKDISDSQYTWNRVLKYS